jgi:hypothetical protein
MGCRCGSPNLDQSTEMKPEIVSVNRINTEILQQQEEHMKKYSDYPEKMVSLINKIRQNPNEYADIIEDSIKNIIKEDYDENQDEPRFIYKDNIKVALTRGEPAFREAAGALRIAASLPPLIFKEEICIPLPDNIEDFKDSNYLRKKVKELLSQNEKINLFYKEMVKIPEISALLMVVDDNGKNSGKKRNAILNKDYKFIGISYRFIGKTFISYFTFSK